MARSRRLTHVDSRGAARMVDVSAKAVTSRRAVAEGFVRLAPTTLRLVRRDALAKGDVLATARLAGIKATKRTADLIPLCHPLAIDGVRVDVRPASRGLRVTATGAVRWSKPTGKEWWSSPSAWHREGGWVLLANGQAWNPADGSALWTDKPKGWSHGWSTPAIEGDRVAVMGGSKGLLVGQMSGTTVRIVAEVELSNGGGNAAIAKGRVYACGARVEGKTDTGKPKQVNHVVGVDAATGALLWDNSCPGLGGVGGQWSFASVTVAGDVVPPRAEDARSQPATMGGDEMEPGKTVLYEVRDGIAYITMNDRKSTTPRATWNTNCSGNTCARPTATTTGAP